MAPNWFASFALIVWPLVAIWLYASQPVVQATIWTILAAELLLPVGTFFKFAMIPQLDKSSIPSLCALLGSMFVAKTLTASLAQIWSHGSPDCNVPCRPADHVAAEWR